MSCAACQTRQPKNHPPASGAASLVIAELAVAEAHWPEAAREYAHLAAASNDRRLIERATAVAGQANEPALALVAAERWLKLEPESRDAHLAAAIAALQLHRIDASSKYLAAIVSSASDRAQYDQLGEELSSAGNAFGARQVVDRVTAPYLNSAAAQKLRGAMRSAAEDDVAAIESFRKSLAIAPDADLSWALAHSLAAAGMSREAIDLANRNLAARSAWADQLEHAIVLISLHREPAAQAELESLAESAESRAPALRVMGQLQLQLGNEDSAAACFTQLLSEGKFLDDAFYFLGSIHERRHQTEAALRSYARVSAGAHYLPAMLRIAALLRRSGAAAQSDALYGELLRATPTRAPLIIAAHAQALSEESDDAAALGLLASAVRDYPDSVELRYQRAQVLEHGARVDEAVAELKGVLRSRPEDPAAMNALGYTLADHSRTLAHAQRLIDSALAAAPQSPAILDSRGWLLYRQEKPEQAIQALSAAFGAENAAEIGAHLGEVLWTSGRRAEAVQVWDQARIDEPDNPLLESTRRRLEKK